MEPERRSTRSQPRPSEAKGAGLSRAPAEPKADWQRAKRKIHLASPAIASRPRGFARLTPGHAPPAFAGRFAKIFQSLARAGLRLKAGGFSPERGNPSPARRASNSMAGTARLRCPSLYLRLKKQVRINS